MEGTRSALADMGTITPWWQRWAFAMLPRHRVLLVGSTMLAVGQRLRLIPARLGLGRIPVRRGPKLRSTGPDVWLLTGCVMDAWQRPTHRNTGSVLSNVGVTYTVPKGGSGCCGALHVHAGLRSQAIALARNVIRSMPGSNPIVVNSAGCGAMLKDYGHLIGTEEAIAFSDRVVDIHEFLEPRIDQLTPSHQIGRVIVQDPCHLRHVQQRHQSVRSVLAAVGEVVELDHDGLCCGAGGAYSALQPELAQQIRQRTVEAIARAGGGVVASANPGCAMHLTAAGIVVKHPMDLLAEALR